MIASIRLVLFDLEGVLSHYDRAARVERLAALSGRTGEVVRHAIWGSGLEAQADAGMITDDEYLRELGVLLNYPVSRADWLASRRASITPDETVLALAGKVAEHRQIAILTNNCRLLTDHIGYLNPPVGRLFGSRVYSSASFGAAKPAAQTYLRCLERIGVPAAETLFVDDSDANVSGAIDAGLQGYRFVSAAGLSDELTRRGLL
ncbi:HAD-superfamily hydrolase, subfamily IA, variant 3 [Paraburkholderia ribeironis]|uniref:HAD-superfamily hydrolase, subfamily IA, variant 3 n=1 Tax=Paraburkholderia ribeironis TaxID=1247936 RepID=A0A1N7SJ00_9BURK|nr:HAD family phosphatase [Paraburkholderia ribeironis]SIT47381.1 HAD-superfamily hydrolase, subfamily IA, variant 3 [Paraburkholderia ribeironis]